MVGSNFMSHLIDKKSVAKLGSASLCVFSLLASGLSINMAVAQEQKAPRASSRLMEEVVVSAQKREESLQDVPISIQAYSEEVLDARGITEVTQLAEIVPGLQFTDTVGFTQIYLRGIGTDAISPSADPSVATYLDGVYLPAGHGVTQSLGGIKRIEVLKGPQGTLFGRNSTAGAVSIVTEEPDPDEAYFVFGAHQGSFNAEGIKFHATTPITSWLAVAASASREEVDAYNVQTNFPDQRTLNQAARFKVNVRPTDSIEIGVTYVKTANEVYGGTASINGDPTPLGQALGIQAEDVDRTSDQDYEGLLDSEQEFLYGFIEWTAPWFDTKLVVGDVGNTTNLSQADFDGSAQPIATFKAADYDSVYKSAEIQFLSNESTWFSDKLQWVAGLYYTESDVEIINGELSVAPNILGLVGLPTELTDLVGSLIPLPNSPITDGVTLEFNGAMGTEATSAFLNLTYYFNDWLNIIAGGRYQEETRFLTRSETNALLPGGEEQNLFSFPLRSFDDSNFSPRVVVNTFPTADTMVYLSWSKGYKSATYNIISLYNAPDFVEAEEVESIELGIKTEFFDGALRLNAAAYQTTIDNLQTGFIALQAGGAVTLENAGEAEIKGAEFDALIFPMMESNPGLAISVNAAYLDSEYVDFQEGSGFNENGIFSDQNDFTGNDIVRAPKWTAAASVIQTLPLTDDSELELGVDGYYNSGFFFGAQNSVSHPEYYTLGARAALFYIPWNLRITGFIKNIENKEYFIQKFQTDFGVNSTLGAPRQTGIRLGWEF